MSERFSRTSLLIGEGGVEKLSAARVAVFGLGGVGGYVVEALARAGVGSLCLIDGDKISESNVNRQILATQSTVGRYKADVAAERVKEINPGCNVNAFRLFFLPSEEDKLDFTSFDYVVDAIDTVAGKLAIIKCAGRAGTPVISCMGAGNKLDATAFAVGDIYETKVCPLARVMRRELRKMGVDKLKVVYSVEEPLKPAKCEEDGEDKRRQTPGSISYVPPVAGFIAAGEVIKDLLAAHS